MLGAYLHNSWLAIFAATGVILSAAYALFLYRRIIFGALVKPALQTIQDLTRARDRDPGAAGGDHHRCWASIPSRCST